MTRHRFLAELETAELVRPHGYVRRVSPGSIEASGPSSSIGELCEIEGSEAPTLAQVAAIDEDRIVLVPLESARAIRPSACVRVVRQRGAFAPSDGHAGRAIDALGRPIDGGVRIPTGAVVPLEGVVPRALERAACDQVLSTGLRAIDGLLTIGEGQRLGVFAAAGVGKTSLIEQLAAQIACDRCVLCLVGERGREVEAIWRSLAENGARERYALVAATSDEGAPLRARAANVALCLAEYWRDRGERVLFILDSATRLAMALREIGLAAGEPPTTRAYTPNVFAVLPRIVERCGAIRGGGSITAIMTVLSETDDIDDPIAETMKSLLDGHILLSRSLAERGHFPAIDISKSLSRQAGHLMQPGHAAAARTALAQLGIYEESRIMIESGVYREGASDEIDRAIRIRTRLLPFLQQSQHEHESFADTVARLCAAVSDTHA